MSSGIQCIPSGITRKMGNMHWQNIAPYCMYGNNRKINADEKTINQLTNIILLFFNNKIKYSNIITFHCLKSLHIRRDVHIMSRERQQQMEMDA